MKSEKKRIVMLYNLMLIYILVAYAQVKSAPVTLHSPTPPRGQDWAVIVTSFFPIPLTFQTQETFTPPLAARLLFQHALAKTDPNCLLKVASLDRLMATPSFFWQSGLGGHNNHYLGKWIDRENVLLVTKFKMERNVVPHDVRIDLPITYHILSSLHYYNNKRPQKYG